MMDPIEDEFEMKPLTPGLGFHKRQISLREHLTKSGTTAGTFRKSLPERPEELIKETSGRSSKEIIDELHGLLKKAETGEKPTAIKLTEILPRDIADLPKPKNNPEPSPLANINFQIPDKKISEGTGVRRGAHDDLRSHLQAIPVSFSSMILDGIVVFAVSLLFLVSLILVTGVDLLSVMRSSQTEFMAQFSLVILYFAVYEMYVITSRSFFGCSLGEWTFDLQMGSDEQFNQSNYPLLVFWRTVLSLLTGVVLLPLLSLITGKDMAAKITGLQLFKKNI